MKQPAIDVDDPRTWPQELVDLRNRALEAALYGPLGDPATADAVDAWQRRWRELQPKRLPGGRERRRYDRPAA